MSARIIQIGIDLGTTNSEIAISHSDKVEVIKNGFGLEYTPSVFGYDISHNPVVGKIAYEKLFKQPSDEDTKNFKAEVKRLMGTPERVFFPRANRDFSPEEISAEILKTLKGDIFKRFPDFNTTAVVITTPASFDTIQAEATKRAGNLAGFNYVKLLQEPIAAAIAYEYENSRDENLLVYDLGGGTFDVALISSKDGNLSVLSHNGDNFLGGKDFDKLIVSNLIVPQILKNYSIANFEEKNLYKIKYLAEIAKILLSQYPKHTVEIENIGKDDNGKEINLTIEITREQFENLIKHYIEKTIKLSKKTIEESGINPSGVSKILLVGGPTQIPYVREQLTKEMRIPVDSSMDPLTVVAKGACIFAMGQQIPDEFIIESVPQNAKKVSLHFNPLTSETEESITGQVFDLDNNSGIYSVQIQSNSGHYSSPKIPLKDGKFFETVTLLPKQTNTFWLYLFDKEGNILSIYPDSFSITHGLSVSGAPIPHSIGVAIATKDIANNFIIKEIFEPIFEKGEILPLKSDARKYHTIKGLKKGEDNFLPIKILEGESKIPDRNTFICDVIIKGKDLPYDLPENTEVELILNVNESREVTLDVYIPLIDKKLEARGSISAEKIDPKKLNDEYRSELSRASKIESDCTIEQRREITYVIDSIDKSLKNAYTDEDDKRKASSQLKDLKKLLDDIEKEKEFPNLVKNFEQYSSDIEKMIGDLIKDDNKNLFLNQLNLLKTEGKTAIEENDKFSLIRVNEQLIDLARRVYFTHPGAWVDYYNRIIETSKGFTNPKEAQYYIEKGKRCINARDVEGLRACITKLVELLPPDAQLDLKSVISGITY
jgi:molecular chaperone DnaK